MDEDSVNFNNSFVSNMSITSSEYIPNIASSYRNTSNHKSLSKLFKDIIPWFDSDDDDVLPPREAAAILLLFAKDGQETNGYKLSPKARLCFSRRHKYNVIFRIAAWSLCLLEIFRRPTWSYNYPNDWNNQLIFPTSGIVYAPPVCCELLMSISLLFILYAISLELGYEKQSNRLVILKIFLFILSIKLLDMIIAIFTYIFHNKIFFSSTPLEALAIIFVEKKFSSKIWYFVRTLPKFFMIISLLASLICTYTAIGFLIFDPNSLEGQQYFPTYGVALWNMLMMLNGSDWPTPMMPAYNLNRGYFLYFFVYLVVFDWGLLNVILGFIYIFFKTEKESSSNAIEIIQNTNICRAFHVLDIEGKGFLTYIQVMDTIEVLFKKFEWRDLEPNDLEKYELVRNLDKQQNGIITLQEFLHVLEKCDGHSLRVLRSKTHFQRLINQNSVIDVSHHNSVADDLNLQKYSNNNSIKAFLLDSNPSSTINTTTNNDNTNVDTSNIKYFINLLRQSNSFHEFMLNFSLFCDSIYFDVIVDTLTSFIGIFYIINVFNILTQNVLIIILLIIYLSELVLKLIIKGFFRYRKSYRSSFDGILTIALLVVFINNCVDNNFFNNSEQYGLRVLVLIRIMLYPRNLLQTKRFTIYRRRYKYAFEHAFSGAGHFIFLLIFLLVFMYIFSALGLQVFGGVIKYNNNNIETSLYGQSGYWPLNFNDICSGFVTIFVLLHVNNMHVTTSGFVAGTNSLWAEVFFATWYTIGVLLLLNIIIVFFLTEFLNYLQSSLVHRNVAKHDQVNPIQDNLSEPIQSVDNPIIKIYPIDEPVSIHNLSKSINNYSSSTISHLPRSDTDLKHLIESNSKFSMTVFADLTNRETLKEKLETAFRASKYGGKKTNRFSNVNNDLSTMILEEEVSDSFNTSTRDIINNENQNITINDRFNLFKDWFNGKLTIEPFEKAAVLVQLARDGVDHQVQFLSKRRSLDCYRIWNKYSNIFRLSSWLLTIVRVFERPLWTYSQNNDWNDSSIYPMSGIPFLPFNVVISIKFILIFILLIGLLLELGYEENSYEFLKMRSFRTISRYLLMLYAVVQLIVTIIAIQMNDPPIILLSSFLVEIYVFWFNRKSLQKLIAILSIIPQMMIIIGILATLVLFFAIFGPYIYSVQNSEGLNDDYDFTYLGTYGNSVWSIFVAITSSSYPNQVIPAYRINRAIFFYFFVFITIGAFGILNFILVYVLFTYQKAIQRVSDARKVHQNLYLLKAFEIMDNEHLGYITKYQVKQLFDELYSYYYDFRKYGIPNEKKRLIMVSILDVDNDDKISIKDFFFILDITRLSLKDKEIRYLEKNNIIEYYFPTFKNTLLYKYIYNIIYNRYTSLIVEILLVVLIIASLSSTSNIFAQDIISTYFAIVIYIIMLLESCIKLLIHGRKRFLKRIRYLIDITLVILLTFLFMILIILSFQVRLKHSYQFANILIAIRVIETLRLIIFPRNVRYFVKKKLIVRFSRIMTRIFRSLASLTVAFYIIAYIFISIGILCYGGKITTSNSNGNPYYDKLVTSNYGLNGFYTLNFNDYPSGFVTLFCCLHVSDFDVIASGFVAVTTSYSRIFFTIWYVVGVLLLLNIIKSFFLAGFLQGIQQTDTAKKSRYVPFNSNVKSDKSESEDESNKGGSRINLFDDEEQPATIELSITPIKSNKSEEQLQSIRDESYRETFAIDPNIIESKQENKPNISIRNLSTPEPSGNNYIVSMEYLKDLNGSDREKLRLRLQDLSLALTPLGPSRTLNELWKSYEKES